MARSSYPLFLLCGSISRRKSIAKVDQSSDSQHGFLHLFLCSCWFLSLFLLFFFFFFFRTPNESDVRCLIRPTFTTISCSSSLARSSPHVCFAVRVTVLLLDPSQTAWPAPDGWRSLHEERDKKKSYPEPFVLTTCDTSFLYLVYKKEIFKISVLALLVKHDELVKFRKVATLVRLTHARTERNLGNFSFFFLSHLSLSRGAVGFL